MRGWIALCLLLPMMSGCLSFLDDDNGPDREVEPAGDVDDASQIRITGTQRYGSWAQPMDIPTADGNTLSAIAYEPLTQDANPDGSAPKFPVVVFVHAFGFFKEMYTCLPMGEPQQPAPSDQPCPFQNIMEEFAQNGFITIAYDARGFGRTVPSSTLMGEAEVSDLDTIIDYASSNYAANGKVGVTGISYGGGHALMGLTLNPKVTTAVAHQGWYDLYEALAPGNTPKLEWLTLLGAEATASLRMHPMVYQWFSDLAQRVNMDEVESALDQRSPARLLAGNHKPLLLCQGMQETLLPQIDDIWENHAGFTRAIIHQGGHGTRDPYCWEQTQAWFNFFLRGIDTQVDEWPALQTVDAVGGDVVSYETFPEAAWNSFFLRDPQLTQYAPSNQTFTVSNQLANNPVQEPSAVWDLTEMPNQAIPYQLRQDPSATFFEGAPMEQTRVLIGSPVLELELAPGSETANFQVAAQLIHVDGEGSSRILSRGAYSQSPSTPDINGTATVQFHFTKVSLLPGDMLVLKVGGNDLSWYMEYPGQFDVTFTGHSQLHLPFFEA